MEPDRNFPDDVGPVSPVVSTTPEVPTTPEVSTTPVVPTTAAWNQRVYSSVHNDNPPSCTHWNTEVFRWLECRE